ncbi:hypothetical protein GOBAR_DD34082 [Gossypium barbadense]|nr:hypothetical protein GOBAR_DD34082 [Gossypium barbadense]
MDGQRFSLLHCLLIHGFLSALLLTIGVSQSDKRSYVIYMGNPPKVGTATASLHNSTLQDVLGSESATKSVLCSYKRSFNGFVAELTEEEARKMAGMNGVVSVFPNEKKILHTTRSWDFMGFSQQVRRATSESDVIIGVLDTGIWPESQSFNDEGLSPPPDKWKGICQDANNITCNNKIIGARYYKSDGLFGSNDIISPRDSEGHGTHTASTAAGRLVNQANLFGLGAGTARGGVPSARIAVYKICWSDGCSDADILAAFDDAIADGVDIISLSVGSTTPTDYFRDSIAIGAFHAMRNGILTVTSAGNQGPRRATITNFSPWTLSVAASTIDRKFFTGVKLGNDVVYEGVSINTFDLKNETYPMIYGGDAPNPIGNYTSSSSRICLENSLDPNLVKGKIVLCDRLVSGEGPLIAGAVSFSSRGPNPITPEILKPDLSAPGVDIVAAWSLASPVSQNRGDNRWVPFNIISGTSMSCPHVSAAAAYIKSFHPTWSPSAIKSSLITTASPMSSGMNSDAEFAYGSGHLNPIKAINPGLIYDSNEVDYINFLCGQGYDTRFLRQVTGDNATCSAATNGTVLSDLNYPSFSVFTSSSTIVRRVFNRTVTNVGSPMATYRARVSFPTRTARVRVNPNVLSFTSVGQKLSFQVIIEGTMDASMVSGSFVWDDGVHKARSPIVVFASIS